MFAFALFRFVPDWIIATLTPSAALYRLVKSITRSQYVARVSGFISSIIRDRSVAACTLNHRHPARAKILDTICMNIFPSCLANIDRNLMGIGSSDTIEKALAQHSQHTAAHNIVDWQRRTADDIAALLPARIYRDRRHPFVGRRRHSEHGRIGLCVQSVARFSRSHRRLSGTCTFLG